MFTHALHILSAGQLQLSSELLWPTKNDHLLLKVLFHATVLQVLEVHGGLSEALYTTFNGKDQVLSLMQDAGQARRRRELQSSLSALNEAKKKLSVVV